MRCEGMRRVVESLVRFEAGFAGDRQKLETKLHGFPAWFAPEEKYSSFAKSLSEASGGPAPLNVGYVLCDDWLYRGDKEFLTSFVARSGENADAKDESGLEFSQDSRSQSLLSDWEAYSQQFGSEPHFAIVLWPEFLTNMVSRRFFSDLENLYPEQTRRLAVFRDVTKRDEYPQPTSQSEAVYYSRFHLIKAWTSVVGRATLGGESIESGIRAQLRIKLSNSTDQSRLKN